MQPRKPHQIVVATNKPKTADPAQQYVRKPQIVVASSSNKVEDEKDDTPKLKTVRPELSKRIQQERTALGWTQKELATKACVQLVVVNEYESGKALNNQTDIQKILKALEAGARANNAKEK
jgi:ribosome-binding protein aMBF1 (putative translation factor)